MLGFLVATLWAFSLGRRSAPPWWLAAVVAVVMLFSLIATGIQLQGRGDLRESAALVAPGLTASGALATAAVYLAVAALAYILGRLLAYTRRHRQSGQ